MLVSIANFYRRLLFMYKEQCKGNKHKTSPKKSLPLSIHLRVEPWPLTWSFALKSVSWPSRCRRQGFLNYEKLATILDKWSRWCEQVARTRDFDDRRFPISQLVSQSFATRRCFGETCYAKGETVFPINFSLLLVWEWKKRSWAPTFFWSSLWCFRAPGRDPFVLSRSF
jgi:hypothetical protein